MMSGRNPGGVQAESRRNPSGRAARLRADLDPFATQTHLIRRPFLSVIFTAPITLLTSFLVAFRKEPQVRAGASVMCPPGLHPDVQADSGRSPSVPTRPDPTRSSWVGFREDVDVDQREATR